jgi:hypothetical protein
VQQINLEYSIGTLYVGENPVAQQADFSAYAHRKAGQII